MARLSFKLLALGAAAIRIPFVHSQVFLPNRDGQTRSIDAPGNLSARCKATFGQPVRCDSSLIAVALGGVEPSNDMLTCITDCLSSLVSLQNDQTAACRDESVVDGGNRYPATYTLDQLLFTHSCAVIKYPVTSPPAYELISNGATSGATLASPMPSSGACASHYTVEAGDDCNSVSRALGVSTAMLRYRNGIAADCSNFPKPGMDLCVPETCELYTLKANETCFDISQAHDAAFSATQLISWNPNINRDCSNLETMYNDSKPENCVLRQGYRYCAQLAVATPASGVSSFTTTKPAPAPAPTQHGMVENCNKFYKVKSGDGCYDIAAANEISLDVFYSFNPTVGNDCSKLFLDYYVCVGV
ncbi:hypothetical protein EsHS_00006051 [Epichloe bromicola]